MNLSRRTSFLYWIAMYTVGRMLLNFWVVPMFLTYHVQNAVAFLGLPPGSLSQSTESQYLL